MRNIYFIFVILLILCSSVIANHHLCTAGGCRDGPGRLKCQSCNPGCYGYDCRHICRGEYDADGCDRTTGECFKCKLGLYGPRCSKGCPNDCLINSIHGHTYCDRQTGSCQEHCESGKTGSHCHDDCPINCKLSVCTKSEGKCFVGCSDGWSGARCDKPCGNYLHGECAGDGHCIIHCKTGYFGDGCERMCPHCYITGCDRHSGICDQCHPGYHGKHCNHDCPAKCYQGRDGHRHCNRTNGHCVEGCEYGYHGSHCKTPCSSNCRQNECYTDDGFCTHPCEKGRYGSHCNAKCENCKSGCNRHSGVCIDGCKTGYHGERCDEECRNCLECDQLTGRCLTCHDGFHGDTCSSHCNYINCKNDVSHINGTCINGCKLFYHGNLCENKCNKNCETCNQLSGECVRCEQSYRLENGDCHLEASNVRSSDASVLAGTCCVKMNFLFSTLCPIMFTFYFVYA